MPHQSVVEYTAYSMLQNHYGVVQDAIGLLSTDETCLMMIQAVCWRLRQYYMGRSTVVTHTWYISCNDVQILVCVAADLDF